MCRKCVGPCGCQILHTVTWGGNLTGTLGGQLQFPSYTTPGHKMALASWTSHWNIGHQSLSKVAITLIDFCLKVGKWFHPLHFIDSWLAIQAVNAVQILEITSIGSSIFIYFFSAKPPGVVMVTSKMASLAVQISRQRGWQEARSGGSLFELRNKTKSNRYVQWSWVTYM